MLCISAIILFPDWAIATDPLPTILDVQIAGRVLSFIDGHRTGNVDIAIVYNALDAASWKEATALATLLGAGRLVGDMFLQPHLVEQANLTEAGRFDALFMMAGVDGRQVMSSMRAYHIPCITRHIEQVENSTCTVAITSAPTVNIVASSKNSEAIGIRFATAFRMMVREI